MVNVMVTGGAGFIGSHFIKYSLEREKYNLILNYDKLTYAGNLENLKEVEDYENYLFVKGDICDKKKVNEIVNNFKVDCILNFAAESHVDKSLKDNTDFIKTNVEGTKILLDIALKYDIKKFVQIGTDEVYGSLKMNSPSSKEKDRRRLNDFRIL